MHFGKYITPEEAHKLDSSKSLKEWRRRANTNERCDVCGKKAWKFAGLGMCFPCTTGESDPSDDYELI